MLALSVRIVPVAFRILPAALLLPILSGCVTSVVSTAVTAPFKVAGKAVDWTTTSQEEADRNLGRKMRKEQEKREKEERRAREEQ